MEYNMLPVTWVGTQYPFVHRGAVYTNADYAQDEAKKYGVLPETALLCLSPDTSVSDVKFVFRLECHQRSRNVQPEISPWYTTKSALESDVLWTRYKAAYAQGHGTKDIPHICYSSREMVTFDGDKIKEVLRFVVAPLYKDKTIQVGDSFRVLLRDSKKGVYARIAEDGSDALSGKKFYPAKSWKDAHCGVADVTVSKISKSYGYITGEMVKVTAPEHDQLRSTLFDLWKNHSLSSNARVQWKHLSTGERFVFLKDTVMKAFLCEGIPDGNLGTYYKLADAITDKDMRLDEFVLNCDVKDITSPFVISDWAKSYTLKWKWTMKLDDLSKLPAFASNYQKELVQEAVARGLLTAKTCPDFQGLNMLLLSATGLLYSLYYSSEEMDLIASYVKAVAESGDTELKLLVAHGKVHLKNRKRESVK